MKTLIERLRDGEIIIKNDGTLEELRRVLSVACPDDKAVPSGSCDLYCTFRENGSNLKWTSGMMTIKTVSVKEFIKELDAKEADSKEWMPEFGELIEVSANKEFKRSEERIFLGYIKQALYPFCTVSEAFKKEFEKGEKVDHYYWEYARPIKPKKQMTVAEISKELGYEIEIIKG